MTQNLTEIKIKIRRKLPKNNNNRKKNFHKVAKESSSVIAEM